MKKNGKKKKKHISHYFPLFIFIISLFMGIGYASINSVSLGINGSATALYQGKIFIANATSDNNLNSVISRTDTLMHSQIYLSDTDINSTTSFEITIQNNTNGSITYDGTSAIIDDEHFYSNSNIDYVVTGIQEGQSFEQKEITFTITFFYKDNVTSENISSINHSLESYINFIFSIGSSICEPNTNFGECLLINETQTDLENAKYIISNKTFNTNEIGTTENGLFRTIDDFSFDTNGNSTGNYSYFYRGNVDNNWVSYAGSLWRIVRINGNDSIRMIYSGEVEETNHNASNAAIYNSRYVATSNILGRRNYSIATMIGYMYNSNYILDTSPKVTIKSPANASGKDLDETIPNHNFQTSGKYYFFNEFDLETNCDLETEKCSFTTNCPSNNQNCYVYSTWDALINAKTADADGNTIPANYTTDKDLYGSTTDYWYYTNPYKYVCNTNLEKVENADGSITINCPLVVEVLGGIKTSATSASKTQAKVKYHGIFSNGSNEAYKNTQDNLIKSNIDSWYESKILGTEYENYLDKNAGFCNDRTYDDTTSNGYNFDLLNDIIYGANLRNTGSNTTTSLLCPNEDRDLFTTQYSSKGNKKLNYPIGLITIDEVVLAGGKNNTTNKTFYLNSGDNYWTMSPYSYNKSNLNTYMWSISGTGVLSSNYTHNSVGIRPVVNLNSNVVYIDGDGTETNPFEIQLNN